jgi:hypothetical protein
MQNTTPTLKGDTEQESANKIIDITGDLSALEDEILEALYARDAANWALQESHTALLALPKELRTALWAKLSPEQQARIPKRFLMGESANDA